MEERTNRIKEVLNWLKANRGFKSNRSIAEKIGYNASMISQVITGKAKVSSKLVLSLSSLYPNLSYEWIWNGTGTMIKEENKSLDDSNMSDNLLERFTIIMDNMAQMMNNISLMVGPLNQEINELRSTVSNQRKEINKLKNDLKRMKAAISI